MEKTQYLTFYKVYRLTMDKMPSTFIGKIITGKLVTRSDLVEGLLKRPRGIDRPGVRERFTGKG